MTNQPIYMVAPDHEETREDMHLLVWRDLPYWTVVDDDLHKLLKRIDGTSSLEAIIEGNPTWCNQRDDILRALANFRKRNIVHYKNDKPLAAKQPGQLRIENIAVNITNRCNLCCRFCYNSGRDRRSDDEELSAEEITSFMEGITPCLGDTPSVSILGGEPLLVLDKTLALAEYGRRKRYRTILSTNGILVSRDFAKRAGKLGLQVQVSLDGATAQVSDAVRGKGAYARTLAGVKLLTASGAYTILSLVCHKDNMTELTAFYELALSLRVNEARFIPLKKIGAAKASGLEPPPTTDLMAYAARMFLEHPEFKPLSGRDAFSILATTCRYSMKRQSCGTGSQTFLLDSTGDIFPCLNTANRDMLIGNIRDRGFDLTSAWHSSPILHSVRRKTSVDDMDNECCDCEVKYWCLGGCRGESLSVMGCLNKKAWNCREQRRAILDVFWVLAKAPDCVRRAAQFE